MSLSCGVLMDGEKVFGWLGQVPVEYRPTLFPWWDSLHCDGGWRQVMRTEKIARRRIIIRYEVSNRSLAVTARDYCYRNGNSHLTTSKEGAFRLQ